MADRLCVRLQSGKEGLNSPPWLTFQRSPFVHKSNKPGKDPQRLEWLLEHLREEISELNLSYLMQYKEQMEQNTRKECSQAKRLEELRAVCRLNVCKDFKKMTDSEVKKKVKGSVYYLFSREVRCPAPYFAITETLM